MTKDNSQPVPPPVNQPAAAPQPNYQPQPGQPVYQQPASPSNPGETMGIVALIMNFLGISLVGLILGIVSYNQSKKAGAGTAFGIINIIWGAIGTFAWISIIFLFIVGLILSGTS